MTIVDKSGTIITGPIGENAADLGGGSIGNGEAGRLEVDPSSIVTNGNDDDIVYSSFGTSKIWNGYTKMQDFSGASRIEKNAQTVNLGIALQLTSFNGSKSSFCKDCSTRKVCFWHAL